MSKLNFREQSTRGYTLALVWSGAPRHQEFQQIPQNSKSYAKVSSQTGRRISCTLSRSAKHIRSTENHSLQMSWMLCIALQIFRFVQDCNQSHIEAFGSGSRRGNGRAQIYLLETFVFRQYCHVRRPNEYSYLGLDRPSQSQQPSIERWSRPMCPA